MSQSTDNPNHQDDLTLIRQTLAGDPDAFADLVRKYQDRLFNGLVHVLRNQADAEEAMQDCLVKAYTKLDTFKGESQFFTWLYRIAHNTAISQIRKRKPTVSLDGVLGGNSGGGRNAGGSNDRSTNNKLDLPGDQEVPSHRLEQQEQHELLHAALGRLSVEHRSVLVLREMDGLDYEAIAEALEMPVGTVRSRLHRARSCLKEELEKSMAADER